MKPLPSPARDNRRSRLSIDLGCFFRGKDTWLPSPQDLSLDKLIGKLELYSSRALRVAWPGNFYLDILGFVKDDVGTV